MHNSTREPAAVPASGGGKADLHTHSTASDGELPPAEVVARARRLGITRLALTDHDTVDGLAEASLEGARVGLAIIPGVEISAQEGGVEVHVLGLFIDAACPTLVRLVERLRDDRQQRLETICAKLRALGLPLAPAEVVPDGKHGTIGRPHVARALVAKGLVRGYAEAFDRYLATDRPAYVRAHDLEPAEAIETIHGAGGIASLAHPATLRNDSLVERIAALGIDALEAFHGDHDTEASARYRQIADRLGLGVTGGSDFHGPRAEYHRGLGETSLPWADFVQLEARCARRSPRR